jgi:hypothetical protein
MHPETIKIDEQEYIRKDKLPKTNSNIRIVILQRGWVMVGYFSQTGEQCKLEKPSVIRVWGTKKGLGQIAESGPTPTTVLDKCPTVRFHELTVIATIDCVEGKWEGKL